MSPPSSSEWKPNAAQFLHELDLLLTRCTALLAADIYYFSEAGIERANELAATADQLRATAEEAYERQLEERAG